MARKNITKKVRFETFKRDSFTCQYCGRMAPDVVLEVDHINPVANGGDNDVMNLITSCFDCNRGKGKRKLTDKDEIKKQQEQLKELNTKREQLKMMLEWRKELQGFDNELLQGFLKIYTEKTGYTLTDVGKEKAIKWIKDFGLMEVLECLDISVRQYFDESKADKTIYKTFDYIPKIANVRKKTKADPLFGERHYIKGILRNRVYVNENVLMSMLKGLQADELDLVKGEALTCKNWTEFRQWFEERWDYR